MIKAVLFDMDGTIFDTEKVLKKALIQSARDLGITPDIEADFFYITGRSQAEVGAYFTQKYGSDFPYDEWLNHRYEISDVMIATHGVPLKAGIPQVFEELKRRDVRMAIATSTHPVRVDFYMKQCGLAHYFDAIVTASEVKNGKPAPDIFLLAASRVGISPESCAVVEDSCNGILGANAAGMLPVFVPDMIARNESFADKIGIEIPALTELIPALKSAKLL